MAVLAAASCSSSKATGNGADGGSYQLPVADPGSSSGGGEATGDDSAAPLPTNVDAGSCLGASALAALGKSRMLIGGNMQTTTAAMAPFDLFYEYISGGLFDGSSPCTSCATGCTTGGGAASCASSCSWWGCWQYDEDPPGDYVRSLVSSCEAASQIPMISYYQLLQSSGVSEGPDEITKAATDVSFMTRYFADWRFLLEQIGQSVAILHIEPDFWGYAEQQGPDPHKLAAAVSTANATDCSSMENSIAGMGTCMIAMVRKYAPHALVGLHASAWSTNVNVSLNTSTTLDVAAQAQTTAAFLSACGGSDADLVMVETSDRDAGYDQVVMMQNTWWDATNATLPDFHQDFAWVKALTEALGRPALYWQTPYGNENMPNAYTKNDAGTDVAGQWKDNRVDYFFANMSELAAAHAIGAAFGAGAALLTTAENDGGNFVSKAKAYFASGGQSYCSP